MIDEKDEIEEFPPLEPPRDELEPTADEIDIPKDPNAPPISNDDKPSYLDTSDPNSIVSLLPNRIRYFVERIPPTVYQKTPGILKTQILSRDRKNDLGVDTKQTLELLRLGLWEEYNRVQQHNRQFPNRQRKINLAHVYSGIVSSGYFAEVICENPLKLAYILIPPTLYMTRLESVLDRSLALLESALEVSPIFQICRCHYGCVCKRRAMKTLAKGQKKPLRGPIWSPQECACDPTCICPKRIDSKHLAIIMEIHHQAEIRLKGAVIQKISQETFNKNVNVNIDAKAELPVPKKDLTMAEIEARLEELKKPKVHVHQALPTANALNAMPVFVTGNTPQLLEPEVLDKEDA